MGEAMRDRIIATAWRLFDEKGYDATTVDQIIEECGISKGGFYHYFRAKDDLLEELTLMLDREYERIELPGDMGVYDRLLYATTRVYRYIEEHIPVEILALVYSSQVVKKGDKYLLNHRRYYFKFLSALITEGQERGELLSDRTSRELVRFYAMQERAVLYDWCICGGNYPLSTYGIEMLDFFARNIRRQSGERG
ncbi:MAG: TetR/AcrR family transcriptional regulator [Oscillospiraceae bacterium]